MSTIRTSTPSVEPITLAEAKAHLRLTHDDEDLQIGSMISAARMSCESRLQRTFISTGWQLIMPGFLPIISLQMGDVQRVTAVTYVDTDGISRELSPSAYQLGRVHGQALLAPAPGGSWPATQHGALEAVSVDYVAGYGDSAADVPQPIRNWILLALGDLFENRQATSIGASAKPLPSFDGLLDIYRNFAV